MEEIEAHDWGITPHMNNQERRQRSIEAYWLDRWYGKLADLTFDTHFYKELPERFPWPSMVRYEDKSPKDSEFFGAVEIGSEAKRIFETSLRCVRNPGKLYCARRWTTLGEEFRCFWNGRVTAISCSAKPPDELLAYLTSIASRIPFYRCVLDIAVCPSREEGFVLVELNSWETNSGAHLFEWTEDELYGTESPSRIVIRWGETDSWQTVDWIWPISSFLPEIPIAAEIPLDQIQPLHPNQPSNWLLQPDGTLIVTNDVWAAVIRNFKPIELRNWRRGPFRFDVLEPTEHGFRAGNRYFYNDLTPSKPQQLVSLQGDDYPNLPFKYGFAARWNDHVIFCRFVDDKLIPVFL